MSGTAFGIHSYASRASLCASVSAKKRAEHVRFTSLIAHHANHPDEPLPFDPVALLMTNPGIVLHVLLVTAATVDAYPTVVLSRKGLRSHRGRGETDTRRGEE